MSATIHRLAWFFFAASATSYGLYVMIGSLLHASENERVRALVLRDQYIAGEHVLSGLVIVPRTCDALTVDTVALSETKYKLAFTTSQQPSVACRAEDVPRDFRVSVKNASENLTFVATLNGTILAVNHHPETVSP